MKIGVKSYDYSRELEYFRDKVDFFEIMAIEGRDYSGFKDFKMPFIIHSQHAVFGINNADKNLHQKNLSSFNYAKKVADMLKAKKIVVHPGDIKNETCSKKNSVDFIKSLKDKRVVIENMPRENSLCNIPEQLKEFVSKTECGICFDVNHAILIAQNLKKDYKDFITEFIKLKPNHFHLGGHKFIGIDHLCFADSELDLKEILSLLPKDAEITLETSKDIEKTKEDLRIIREVLKEI